MKSKQFMLYIGGNKFAYRCECGANVFHLVSKKQLVSHKWKHRKVYECNGCGAWYSDADEKCSSNSNVEIDQL